ncbi:MAG: hypothetical protein QXO55_07250 [Candidatus Korarchaeum sp.]
MSEEAVNRMIEDLLKEIDERLKLVIYLFQLKAMRMRGTEEEAQAAELSPKKLKENMRVGRCG